ncbi:3-oxoacyl-ACP reductase family protein [Pseudonocardia alaniniphila]|uniref:3-oxoacyl-ACP reductase FabG n=1 Tax=Pseudonocardia alaniniphila TaxID=75291 RepID=A0ABS9TEV0_9PSEU|nr:3-oxoacyl-ACP reductase family protein [Pseudonocardia alaniniphila]MCH6166928.1 3-oxoacyl-ACP reductase FabG [Pseudonocardia alaniniphila]
MNETVGPLDGKVALVTGGSRGIGAGIAKRLAADGATVALTYASSKDQAEQVAADIAAAGGTAFAIHADSTVEADVIGSVTETVSQFGRLDILVNNAGGGSFARIDEMPMADIDRTLAVNVRAVIVAIRESLKHMGEGSRIINIGSINAERVPFPGISIYAASKGAIAGLTKGLARELAPKGITINNVQPGPVNTDSNSADGPAAPLMLSAMALDRFGDASEIGAFVSFLAGPDGGFVTGASLNIDGGYTS